MKKLKPFIKWVGGKRQLLDELNKIIDNEFQFKKYHEPFIGGGALFFDQLTKGRAIGSINDLNKELVVTYKAIRDEIDGLVEELYDLQSKHTRFAYYDVRKMDRDGRLDAQSNAFKAARMIYLNKTGYNGIYRVNQKNEFNVPIGSLWGSKIFDEKELRTLNKSLNKNKIKIFNESYEYVYEEAKPGDLVYFDPPYDSFESSDNFVGYQKEGFNRNDQRRLKELCDRLIDNGVGVILSNHNTDFIKELYSDERYYKHEIVSVTRSLNSDSNNRSKKPIEIIIYGGNNGK